MRYSVVMPYYKRPELRFLLSSFCSLYAYRDDIEIIIVEDSKNYDIYDLHEQLLQIVKGYEVKLNIKVIQDSYRSYNPCKKYNIGVREASGDIIMLTNPETPHTVDIFKELDAIDYTNSYVICDCANVKLENESINFFDTKFSILSWLQQGSKSRNLHYCSVLSKANYDKIGGFDEQYCNGVFLEDHNFIKRIEQAHISIINREDLIVYHIDHLRDYSITSEEHSRLVSINTKIWDEQLKNNKF